MVDFSSLYKRDIPKHEKKKREIVVCENTLDEIKRETKEIGGLGVPNKHNIISLPKRDQRVDTLRGILNIYTRKGNKTLNKEELIKEVKNITKNPHNFKIFVVNLFDFVDMR